MNKTKLFFGLFIILSLTGILLAQRLLHPRGVFLSVQKVEKRWGNKPFDPARFKTGDMTTRASMAASILKDKSFIGKTNEEIWALLGRHDGYYFSDLIPTYLIEDNSLKGGDSWQIVFFIDMEYKVKSIRVHKNGSEILNFP